MLSIKGLIIPAAIGYGLYYTLTHYDIAIFPPMDKAVREAIVANKPELNNYGINITRKCAKTKGSVTDAVFTCGVDFNNPFGNNREHFVQTVMLAKKKGKWKVLGYGNREDAP